ncbi:MAG TPA: hypothetical protein VNA69_18950 [Thermoanaerobaculia bacterium]|nr:hypothetical protein [Thermoanaerobaculia bacterium]
MAIILGTSLPAAAGVPVWKLDVRERAERRADPVRNARHHAAFAARGQWIEVGNSVVDGSLDPGIFAPIELMDQVILVFNADPDRRQKFRREWTARGAPELLGNDFWNRLHVMLGPAIAIERENRRVGALPPAERDEVMQSRAAHQPFNDGGECAARADALAAARAAWGEVFDRFLYEVVAPGVRFWTSCSDPALLTRPESWLDKWEEMGKGCR